LLDELEKKLLAELRKMLLGADQDVAGVEHAAKIMGLVEKATVQHAEAEVGVAQLTGASIVQAADTMRPQ
jgi:hypothetical protein